MKPRTPFHELIPPWRTSLFIVASAAFLLALVPGILAIPAAQSPNTSVVVVESEGYTIPAHVVAAGGGQRSSTNYTIWDTAGQAAYFEPIQSNNYQVLAGYWHRLPISIAPNAPTLYAIPNPHGDGDYLIDWSDVADATSYTVEEDSSESFSTPSVVYQDSSSEHAVTGQTVGTWYYRVRAYTPEGDSPWSNIESVVVSDEPGELIAVSIWANSDFEDLPSHGHTIYLPLVVKGITSAYQAWQAYTVSNQSGEPPTAQERVVSYLTSHGYETSYVSSESPLVFASLPANIITDLQEEDYVAAITLQNESVPYVWSAARTAAAHMTWARGITGSGIKVAVVEDGGVAFDNELLNDGMYYDDEYPRVDAHGGHATEVAGVIASQDETNKGVSYDVEILSANAKSFWDGEIAAATDWAIDQGADVINCSFGYYCQDTTIEDLDKYFDWIVWNTKTSVIIAAGNLTETCPSNFNVQTPGKGYNVITVGSKDDRNTADLPSDVNDDRFSWFSLYVDPNTQSDARLKPEVIATGEKIYTTGISDPWIITKEVSGTSFAAPIVAGEAALMMQRGNWLKDSPEAVKAGIMASAKWTQLNKPDGTCCASEDEMGVGAVDTTAADNSIINDRVQGVTLRRDDFVDDHYDFYFDGLQNQRIRVVIIWSSHPARLGWGTWVLFDTLESDFDLTVTSPLGPVVGASAASERNYEIVEFVAPVTGSYRARVHLDRWDWTNQAERLGFAWYSGDPLADQMAATARRNVFSVSPRAWNEGLVFATSWVAKAQGVDPDMLEIVREERVTYSLVGETLYRVKLWNPSSGSLHKVVLNENLQVVDEADIQDREMKAYIAKYGKLQRELYDLIQARNSSP